ncbi:hypothetical protein J6A31_06655 [bacterium]|nr:hypothetical protein [bacterium]
MEYDPIKESILASGHILNDNLTRKWLVSQTIKYHIDASFNKHFFQDKPYSYQWNIVVKNLKMMNNASPDELYVKTQFTNKTILSQMLDDYKRSISTVRLSDNSKQIISSLEKAIHSNNRYKLIKSIQRFIKNAPMPNEMQKSTVWMAAFKAEGAYYTMDYLIKYNNCMFIDFPSTNESLFHLKTVLSNGSHCELCTLLQSLLDVNESNLQIA